MNDFTIIGKIINTRGIKGELKVLPITGDVDRFSDLGEVFVGEDLESIEISNVKYDNRFVYIKFKDFNNINDVLKFKDKYLYVDDSQRIQLDENTFFISDIIGCRVENLDSEALGKIVDVIENPSNDVYVIENDRGQFLVPAVFEFVKKVDVDNKLVIISPIEGMVN